MSIFMEIIVLRNYTHLFEASRGETEHDRLVWKWPRCAIGPASNKKDNATMSEYLKWKSWTCFCCFAGRSERWNHIFCSIMAQVLCQRGRRSITFMRRFNKVINLRRLIVCSTLNSVQSHKINIDFSSAIFQQFTWPAKQRWLTDQQMKNPTPTPTKETKIQKTRKKHAEKMSFIRRCCCYLLLLSVVFRTFRFFSSRSFPFTYAANRADLVLIHLFIFIFMCVMCMPGGNLFLPQFYFVFFCVWALCL